MKPIYWKAAKRIEECARAACAETSAASASARRGESSKALDQIATAEACLTRLRSNVEATGTKPGEGERDA